MLPFFVYGTLLPKQPNYPLWADAIERLAPATLADATLFNMGHFPMMVTYKDAMVKGAVVWISAEKYTQTLTKIDRLERFIPHDHVNSLYQRKAVTVRTQHEIEVLAWAYFGDQWRTRGCQAIGGDWLAYLWKNCKH